jgi:threonine dehydrogenase-like Zn-dependent dehydrogenase
MRAAMFVGAGLPLVIETCPDPTPGAHQVVLKVGRCGICGTDLHWTSGPRPRQQKGRLGHEFAGEVVARGRGVERLKIGDRVAAMPMMGCGECEHCSAGCFLFCAKRIPLLGGFAEYTLADERSAYTLPADLSMEDGALVEPLAAALNCVRICGISKGARVLVIGAGAMGLGATFWARHLGAGPIAVSARSNSRADLCLRMGATAFIPTGDDYRARVRAALGGAPDVVFECAGQPGTIAQAIDAVRACGVVGVLGMCDDVDNFHPIKGVVKQVRVQFSAAYTPKDFELCVDTMARGSVEPRAMVVQTIGLAELPATFEALRHDSSRCRVHVDPFL